MRTLPVRYYNLRGPDRVAVVSSQEVFGRPGWVNLVVARGPRRTALKLTATRGPFAPEALAASLDALDAELRAEGFAPAGQDYAIKALQSFQPRLRAHAAARLGWRRVNAAVPELLRVAAVESIDLTSVVEALGRIGDPRGLSVCRAEADRLLLSRRRAGAEALRNLSDTVGLDAVRARALKRLPEAVAALVEETRDATWSTALQARFDEALKGVEAKALGLCLDTLYDLGAPLTDRVVAGVMGRVVVEAPHQWRYTRSIAKRAMARGDFAMLALVSRRVELATARSKGTFAPLKSGLDGSVRRTRVFGPGTQRYWRRVFWRYLHALARSRPAEYAFAAAEFLCAWRVEDRKSPGPTDDGFSRAYTFNQVFRGGDASRYFLNPRSLRWRPVRTGPARRGSTQIGRTERFASLWDATPRAYLRVLADANIPEVLAWALEAVSQRHPTVLAEAALAEVLALVGATLPAVAALGLAELDRRFDPKRPDTALLEALCNDGREVVRRKAAVWLGQSAARWSADLGLTMRFLTLADGALRQVAVDCVLGQLPHRDAFFRRELGELILAALGVAERFDDEHLGLAQVAREGLADALSEVLSLDEIFALLRGASAAARAVAGALLARRPEAVDALGEVAIVAMAGHDTAAVREAAMGLIRGAVGRFADDPSIFFVLIESPWADARAFAFEMLRGPVDLAPLGAVGVLGLLDASPADVRAFGREMALKHFDDLDPQELLSRLIEHPAPEVRRFAVELVVGHLKPGFVALSRVEPVFRAALLDLRPSRAEKAAVIAFLVQRGHTDERQAEVAARLLSELARSKTRRDAERAWVALAGLKLKFPEVEMLLAAPSVQRGPEASL